LNHDAQNHEFKKKESYMQIIISSIIMKKHHKYYVEKLKVNKSHNFFMYFFQLSLAKLVESK